MFSSNYQSFEFSGGCFSFFKPLFISFLCSFHLLPLIVIFVALSLFPQDLEVFDKLRFPAVPAEFWGRSSCPLCLPVQDTWHLQHETWLSSPAERQVRAALLPWAFVGDLWVSPEVAQRFSSVEYLIDKILLL